MTATDVNQIRQALNESRTELNKTLSDLSADQAEIVVYEDGPWTVLDVLRHLVQSERSMVRLMGSLQAGQGGASADFDLDRYNAAMVAKLQDKNLDDLRQMLDEARGETIAFIEPLDEDDWQISGRHGSGRELTLAQVGQLIADHEVGHTADIVMAVTIADE